MCHEAPDGLKKLASNLLIYIGDIRCKRLSFGTVFGAPGPITSLTLHSIRTASPTVNFDVRLAEETSMHELKHQIPAWVTRGKTIRQLIEELQAFEDLDMEVRISLDYGDTHSCISLVSKHQGKFCLLSNAESYHKGAWQDFMDIPENLQYGA
jgi:hypothetical protein